jgi:hypothetical protein
MNPEWVLAKTDKGRMEIATRLHSLAPRARTALILVDGIATIEELCQRTSAFTALELELQQLLEAGFVTVLARRARVSTRAAGAAMLRQSILGVPPPPRRALADLVRMATDAIGPEAIIVTRRMRTARTREDLRIAIERAAMAIEGFAGTAMASQFRVRGDSLLRQRFPTATHRR